MAFCGECGAKLADGAKFCMDCGHEVGGGSPAMKAEPVIKAVEELVGTVVREVDAPSAIGESTLCTWKSAGAGTLPTAVASVATQAVGTAAQKAAVPAAKKSKLPLIMIAAGAIVLVAVFALYVVPLFIFHPVDPNEHTALVPGSSQSTSASASSAGVSSSTVSNGSASSAAASTSASSASTEASSASAESSSSAARPSSEASPTSSGAASSIAAPTSYSTSERPTINDFKWMTGETDKGNAPAGAARIADFGAVTGGWKAYMYGGNLERLFNATIDAGQSGAVVTLDWYYIRDNKADKVFEDTTASSMLEGSFDGGILEAVGAGTGRITLTAFWEQDGHQYATGSFMWPSGETEIVVLVRP